MTRNTTLDIFASFSRDTARNRIDFARDGDAYILSNGVLTLRGAMCEAHLVRSIALNGHNCGSLDICLNVKANNGKWIWPGLSALCKIDFCRTGCAGVLELIGEWWQVVGRCTIPGYAFRVRARVTMRPSEKAFLVEVTEVENSGTLDLRIGRIFISVVPPEGIKPVCVREPTLNENSAAWDAGKGHEIGLRSEDKDVQRISFWADVETGYPHADCGFSLPSGGILLSPNQKFTPAHPISAIVMVK